MSINIGTVVFYNKDKGFGFVDCYNSVDRIFVGRSVCNDNLKNRQVILFRTRDSRKENGKQEISEIIPWKDINLGELMLDMTDEDFKHLFDKGYFIVDEIFENSTRDLKIKILSIGAGYLRKNFFNTCNDEEKLLIINPHPAFAKELATDLILNLIHIVEEKSNEYIGNFEFENYFSSIALKKSESWNCKPGSGDDESYGVYLWLDKSYYDFNAHDPYLIYDFKYHGCLFYESTYDSWYKCKNRYLENLDPEKEKVEILEKVNKAKELFLNSYDKQKHQKRIYTYFYNLFIYYLIEDLKIVPYSVLLNKISSNEYRPNLKPYLPCHKVGITF